MGFFEGMFGNSREEFSRKFAVALDAYNKASGNSDAIREAGRVMRVLADRGYAPAVQFWSDLDECDRGLAAYNRESYSEALDIFLKLAERGSAVAAEMVGTIYLNGLSVPLNLDAAIRYLLIAATHGRPLAGSSLALAYATESPNYNPAKAFEWALWSAQLGVSEAQYWLGKAYRQGFGVQKDFGMSASWLEKAASQEHADAQYLLGCLYDLGDELPHDEVKSAYWLRKASDNGHLEARRLRLRSGDVESKLQELRRIFDSEVVPKYKSAGFSDKEIENMLLPWIQQFFQ